MMHVRDGGEPQCHGWLCGPFRCHGLIADGSVFIGLCSIPHGERQGQRRELAAADVRLLSGRLGWLPFAGPGRSVLGS